MLSMEIIADELNATQTTYIYRKAQAGNAHSRREYGFQTRVSQNALCVFESDENWTGNVISR